jgi:hypothetical protein
MVLGCAAIVDAAARQETAPIDAARNRWERWFISPPFGWTAPGAGSGELGFGHHQSVDEVPRKDLLKHKKPHSA